LFVLFAVFVERPAVVRGRPNTAKCGAVAGVMVRPALHCHVLTLELLFKHVLLSLTGMIWFWSKGGNALRP